MHTLSKIIGYQKFLDFSGRITGSQMTKKKRKTLGRNIFKKFPSAVYQDPFFSYQGHQNMSNASQTLMTGS